MKLRFSKLHGIGNDLIIINELDGDKVNDKPGFTKKFCSRRLGIGADAVIFIRPSEEADFTMQYFNSDGGKAENCVNGLRCIALEKYLLDGEKKNEYRIETLAGLADCRIISFENNKAVVEVNFLGKVSAGGKDKIEIDGRVFEYYSANVGNPHAVIFLEESVDGFPVEEIGHKIEFNEKFAPGRVNTEFVNLVGENHVKMRVHERGACETLACGTGSIAVVAAAIEKGIIKRGEQATVEQPGGKLEITFGEKIIIRGEAEKVFEGSIELE